MNKACPLEEVESIALATWLRINGYTFSHIGNESGQRATPNILRMMKKKKDMGVSSGFPDFLIVLKRGSLLFIEMKRQNKNLSSVSKEQRRWIEVLSQINNSEAVIAYGWQEAVKIIKELEEF